MDFDPDDHDDVDVVDHGDPFSDDFHGEPDHGVDVPVGEEPWEERQDGDDQLRGQSYDEADPAEYDFEPVDPESVVVDPSYSDLDAVAGDPDTDTTFWLYQGEGNGTCAPTSVAMVLADVLDDPMITNDAVVERAMELGLIEWDPTADGNLGEDTVMDWSGMDQDGIMLLCESFGLDVSLAYGDTPHLVEALASDRAVIVALDGDEIWYGEDDDADPQDGGFDSNHAVVVTGIDVENGVVYLNDPGDPEGRGAVIPLAQFEDAWADSGFSMITTDFAEDRAAETVAPIPEPLPEYPKDPGFEDLPGSADQAPADQVQPVVEVPEDITGSMVTFESPDVVPSGVAGLIWLPFTFVVQLVDELS